MDGLTHTLPDAHCRLSHKIAPEYARAGHLLRGSGGRAGRETGLSVGTPLGWSGDDQALHKRRNVGAGAAVAVHDLGIRQGSGSEHVAGDIDFLPALDYRLLRELGPDQ